MELDIALDSPTQGAESVIFGLPDDFKTNATFHPVGHVYEEWLSVLNEKPKVCDPLLWESIHVLSAENNEEEDDGEMPLSPEDLELLLSDGEDHHYEILGLADVGIHVAHDTLKKQFRKMSLAYHPDKTEGNDPRAFKAVAKAFEVLSDPVHKRAYDSFWNFDESVPDPDATYTDKEFYEEFGECFRNNARFSTRPNVPELGDENTPYEQVERFYQFWTRFQSWREWTLKAEHNPLTANDRDEKRWMVKENKNFCDKMKKKENARIIAFVESAMKHDPRVRRVKEEQAAKKQAAREAKLRQKQAAEEAERRKREAEEQAARAAEAAEKQRREEAKAQKEQQRKQRQAERARFRRLVAESGATLAEDEIREYFEKVSVPALATMNATLQPLTGPEAVRKAFTQKLSELRQQEEEEKARMEAERVEKDRQEAERLAKEKEMKRQKKAEKKKLATQHDSAGPIGEDGWSADEIHLLSKLLIKFPGGAANRWERIAELIPGKTADDVLAKTKQLSKNKNLHHRTDVSSAMQRFKEKTADKAIESELSQRYDGGPQLVEAEKPEEEKEKKEKKKSKRPVLSEDGWTAAENEKLEAALKKIGPPKKGDADEDKKWAQVAGAIGTKSAKECASRFKQIRKYYRDLKKWKEQNSQ